MKSSFVIPLLSAISFGAAALLSDLVPSLTVPMTVVSLGIASISTLILLFSIAEARRQGWLKSALISTSVMAAITIGLLLWLQSRVQIEQPITPPQTTQLVSQAPSACNYLLTIRREEFGLSNFVSL